MVVVRQYFSALQDSGIICRIPVLLVKMRLMLTLLRYLGRPWSCGTQTEACCAEARLFAETPSSLQLIAWKGKHTDSLKELIYFIRVFGAFSLETSDVLIKGGEWKLGIDEEPLPFQIVKVAAILRHPDFKAGNLQNDLAVLVLVENLRFTKNIGAICLPEPNMIPTQNCIATGWGKRILQCKSQQQLITDHNFCDVAIFCSRICAADLKIPILKGLFMGACTNRLDASVID